MMRQVLITGTVTSGGGERRPLYAALVATCQPYAERVYSPLDTMELQGSNKERYQRAIELVSTSDLVIAEASVPSTGQGIEIQEACRRNVPLIVLAKAGSKVSGLVLGTPVLREVIHYDDLEQLQQALKERLETLV